MFWSRRPAGAFATSLTCAQRGVQLVLNNDWLHLTHSEAAINTLLSALSWMLELFII